MRILVYRVGQLGDTIVTLPALRRLRRSFPQAELVLLTDQHTGKGYMSSWDILKFSGIFSRVIFYQPPQRGTQNVMPFFKLGWQIRKILFDRLYYFTAIPRSINQLIRDYVFFRGLCGIKEIYGVGNTRLATGMIGTRDSYGHLMRLPPEVERFDQIVKRSKKEGPEVEGGVFDFPEPPHDDNPLTKIRITGRISEGSFLVGLAPGSKMSSKRWPPDRFIELGEKLLKDYPGIYFLILGGEEDRELGNYISENIGSNVKNLAGECDILESGQVLKYCDLFVGNDTGTMHLAAAVGTRCVGIFSARDQPGLWYPFGPNHKVIRKTVPCEGCYLYECREMKNKCLEEISVYEVLDACRKVLQGNESDETLPSR